MDSRQAGTGRSRGLLKELAFRVVILVMVFFGMALLGELGTRVFKRFGYSTFVFRQYDARLGTALIPGSRGKHQRCWDGYVSVNEHGMRDRERTVTKSPTAFRIGIFSDSTMEAVHVKPQETSAQLLEARLNREICHGRCEVLNFSVASYSTVQEYLNYITSGRQWNLDLVLVVTIPNDLVGNVDPVSVMAGSFYHAPYLSKEKGEFRIVAPRQLALLDRVWSGAARRSDLALYLAKLYYHKLAWRFQSQEAFPPWASKPIYRMYDSASPEAQHISEALLFVLDRFRSTVEEDGAELALAYLATENSVTYTPLENGANIRPTVVSDMMKFQLEQFGRKTGTPVHNLGLEMANYIRREGIEWPYLSFSCDPHFSALGHRVIADSLFRFLKVNRLVELSPTS